MQRLIDHSVLRYCNALAHSIPTPGGGSCAALVGVLGVALLEMSMGYSSFSSSDLKVVRKIRRMLIGLVDKDAGAYRRVVQTRNGTERQRQKAWLKATEVPLEIYQQCRQAIRLAKAWQDSIKPTLKSDWAAGEMFLKSACAAAALNVRENIKRLKDSRERDRLMQEWRRLKTR